jgi:hypothetical protein
VGYKRIILCFVRKEGSLLIPKRRDPLKTKEEGLLLRRVSSNSQKKRPFENQRRRSSSKKGLF